MSNLEPTENNPYLTVICHQTTSHYLNQCCPSSMMSCGVIKLWCVNTLRPRQNGRHFADDTFKRIFLNDNVRILIKISPKFVPEGPINNIPALVQIMAWRRPGDKPLSEAMMTRLPTHLCVTRPQWVNSSTGSPSQQSEQTSILLGSGHFCVTLLSFLDT